uniref:AlNc14C5G765 protein n=1 Tax=Albugo laibachii Nc14 TaxID=890382 RepID=F0W0Y5_9STRA|nr:AlNc14C5G765 [Albugo laibachii Nc14]|eukprot:CCA14709.1 AlNc14C5G765 [Albugo laibachii Nc14]
MTRPSKRMKRMQHLTVLSAQNYDNASHEQLFLDYQFLPPHSDYEVAANVTPFDDAKDARDFAAVWKQQCRSSFMEKKSYECRLTEEDIFMQASMPTASRSFLRTSNSLLDNAETINRSDAAQIVFSAQKRKKMLIKHDSIVKGTNNEDNNDSGNINTSDSSDIGSGYETNDEEEEVTHGVAENIERAFNAALSSRSSLEYPTGLRRYIGQSKRTRRRKNAPFKRAAVGTKPLTAYFIKQIAEHEQEGEEDSQQADFTEVEVDERKGKASQPAQNRNNAVKSYLCLLKAAFERGEASRSIVEGAGRGIYFARSICAWAAMFMNGGQLPIFGASMPSI